MTEKQTINNKDIWIKIDAQPANRENPNTIPTEYFVATWYQKDPEESNSVGILIEDEDGEVKLFESPVAALSYTAKLLEKTL